jgi:hypothetical protein
MSNKRAKIKFEQKPYITTKTENLKPAIEAKTQR